MNRFLAFLLVVFWAALAGGMPAAAQDGVPVTLYWHMADDADVYLNGMPLRPYEPSFRYRGDEAPRPAFSAQATLRNGDLITVGGRRGGSYGFMLIAVDGSGRPVFCTNTRDWSVYYPGERREWPVLSQYGPRRPVQVQPNPWPPQKELNAAYGFPALSIWSDPGDRFAYLVGQVSMDLYNGAIPAGDAPPPPADEPSFDVPPETVGVAVASYPELVQVPGYPVYYAPGMNANYFFYDGMFWLFQNDQWYASSWFNGPWGLIRPEAVPAFVLRVPVSYYRHVPSYMFGWRRDAPPRWGEHWGPAWEQRQRGWDQWDRHAVYRPAPLPEYQRVYHGDHYPRAEQQRVLHTEHYRYEPATPVARQHFQQIQHPQPQVRTPQAPAGRQYSTSAPAPAPRPGPGAQPQQPAPYRPAPTATQPLPGVQHPPATAQQPPPAAQHPGPAPQPPAPYRPAPPAAQPPPAAQHPAPAPTQASPYRPAPAPQPPPPAAARPAPTEPPHPGVQHPTPQQAPPAPAARPAPAPAPAKPPPAPAKPAPAPKKPEDKK